MSTTMRPQATHQSHVHGRHHPYAPNSTSASSSSASTTSAAAAGPSRKWTTSASHAHAHAPRASPAPAPIARVPPSPPRSERASGSPPVGLGAAFGGKEGGKWWDEELPAPPASLSSILDSFRRSGEGDRDLLLAILGAKKAEEERLTSLIQTRLTILSARLSVHAASASLDSAASAAAQAQAQGQGHMSMPTPPQDGPSPGAHAHAHGTHRMQMPPMTMSALPERTPSFASRASISSASASASGGPVSPVLAASYATPYDRDPRDTRKHDRERERERESFHLPPPSGLWRRHASPDEPTPIRVDAHRTYLPSLAQGRKVERREMERERERERDRSISPRSEATGIDMLLDAGRRVSETRAE